MIPAFFYRLVGPEKKGGLMRILIAITLLLTLQRAYAAEIGGIWPQCKGWNNKYGVEQMYRPEDLTATRAQEILSSLAREESVPLVGDGGMAYDHGINVVQGYLLLSQAQATVEGGKPSYRHKEKVRELCKWLTTHYVPE